MSPGSKSGLSDKSHARRSYEPPCLARVDLQADEVLANGCKMINWGTGSKQSTINCIVKTCAAAGS